MSQDIWTQCEPKFRFSSFIASPWRVVEGQHQISTRKIVDSDEEHGILEELIETAKPPEPYDQACSKYHYLLWTPFRYPPLKYGSRLGSRDGRGLWYGSMQIETALAEKAYYVFLFRSGSAANFGTFEMPITAFRVEVKSKFCVNLTLNPFKQFERDISSPNSYVSSQKLGKILIDKGAEVICFFSARCPDKGSNIAITNLEVFKKKKPTDSTSWFCISSDQSVEFKPNGFQTIVPKRMNFKWSDFAMGGKMPQPSIK